MLSFLEDMDEASKRPVQRGTDVRITLRNSEHKESCWKALAQLKNLSRRFVIVVASKP